MQSKGGRWRGLSCLVKLGDMGRKVWRGVQKRAGQVQLQCLQVESGLPALLQLLPPDAQLEEKPFCTDTALLCTGVGSPLIFVSVSLFFFPPGANYYLAEMYFLLEKGGLGLFFGVFSVCFFFVCVFLLLLYFFFPIHTDISIENRLRSGLLHFAGLFQNVVTFVSSALYVFLLSSAQHIFQQFGEM